MRMLSANPSFSGRPRFECRAAGPSCSTDPRLQHSGRRPLWLALALLVALVLTAALPAPLAAASTNPLPTVRLVPTDYPSIQEAIDASLNADTVRVLPGTYLERISFRGKSIVVESAEGADVTTIDAERLGRVVLFEGAEDTTTVLRGFTITGGGVDHIGYAVKVSGGAPRVCSNRIVRNGSPDHGSILSIHGTGEVTPATVICHNHVADNTSKYATFTAANDSNVHCLDNSFLRNSGDNAIEYYYSSRGIVRGNTIYRQSGGHGIITGSEDLPIEGNTIAYCDHSAIVTTDHPPRIIGNLIIGNGHSGVLTIICYSAFVANNTIMGSGINAIVAFYTTIETVNNIVVGNELGLYAPAGEGAYILSKNNVAFNGDDYSGVAPGATDIHFSPAFRDSAGNDFRLSVDSPLLDMGSVVEGRPGSGPAPDIGAHELPYPASPGTDISLSIHPVIFHAGQAVTLDIELSDADNQPDTVDVWLDITGSDYSKVFASVPAVVVGPGQTRLYHSNIVAPAKLPLGWARVKARVSALGQSITASAILDVEVTDD